MKETLTIYSYTPTMIFPDFWQVEIFKHEIFNVKLLLFFQRRVRRTTTIYFGFEEKGKSNHAQEWLDAHPEIKLSEFKDEYRRLPQVK